MEIHTASGECGVFHSATVGEWLEWEKQILRAHARLGMQLSDPGKLGGESSRFRCEKLFENISIVQTKDISRTSVMFQGMAEILRDAILKSVEDFSVHVSIVNKSVGPIHSVHKPQNVEGMTAMMQNG
jgi:hypothetical protein